MSSLILGSLAVCWLLRHYRDTFVRFVTNTLYILRRASMAESQPSFRDGQWDKRRDSRPTLLKRRDADAGVPGFDETRLVLDYADKELVNLCCHQRVVCQ